MKFVWMALGLACSNLHAAQATLEISSGKQRVELTQSQLLSRPDVQTISVPDSVYRHRFTQFKAIPIANLFKEMSLPELAVIQCNSTDGFSAILGKNRLFDSDPKASKAFLAIEDPMHPWPHLAGKDSSAGPFYLVWTDPQASGIGREEWPFEIASFVILSDPRAALPNIYPAIDAALNVQNGLKSYIKNCLACHKMNGSGAASIGPDLNLPMNPTEYLQEKTLGSFIRDPASVRTWPTMAMRGFSVTAIPDAELSDLIAYLKYMSGRKVRP